MAAWVRILANPKVLKRFLGTKAGKKATMKWGKMLLESKIIQSAIGKLMNGIGGKMDKNKEYTKMTKEYAALQKKVAKLEAQLDTIQNDNAALEAKTFTLGRQVVEMRHLYERMLAEFQFQNTKQMVIASAARTR